MMAHNLLRTVSLPDRTPSIKILAVVIQALIDCAYMDGGMRRAQACLYRFLPEIHPSGHYTQMSVPFRDDEAGGAKYGFQATLLVGDSHCLAVKLDLDQVIHERPQPATWFEPSRALSFHARRRMERKLRGLRKNFESKYESLHRGIQASFAKLERMIKNQSGQEPSSSQSSISTLRANGRSGLADFVIVFVSR